MFLPSLVQSTSSCSEKLQHWGPVGSKGGVSKPCFITFIQRDMDIINQLFTLVRLAAGAVEWGQVVGIRFDAFNKKDKVRGVKKV